MNDFKTGDLMAFNLLYARHKGPTYRYLLRQCNDQTLTDDLMQELWGKLIKAKGSYQPSAKFTTWLYSIAHHVVIDHHRQSSTRNTLVNESDDIDSVPEDNTKMPEQLASNAQDQHHINHCLTKLPHNNLETFLLKQETDLTMAQIADIVECSFEAAKSRLRYAYDSLRHCLSKTLMRGE